VLLDLDDTLYPERDFVRGGLRAAAAELSRRSGHPAEELFELCWRQFQSGTRGRIFDAVLAELNIPIEPELIQQLVHAYRTHEPHLTLYADADRLLHRLWPLHRLGILTDGDANVQRRKARALDLSQRVQAIVYSDDHGRANWKPSPTPFLTLLRRLKTEPSRAIYVGDNPLKDFIGARQLGLKTVRIRRPDTEHGHRDPEPGFEPDVEITSLDEFPDELIGDGGSTRFAA
jgi:putative hydrolase of the HAD superfamily